MFSWFKPKYSDKEKQLFKQELKYYEQALLWMAQDIHQLYPDIAKVAVDPELLVRRYLTYAILDIRPKLPKLD